MGRPPFVPALPTVARKPSVILIIPDNLILITSFVAAVPSSVAVVAPVGYESLFL